MEPLSISALLFILVVLELSATIKKSTGEGRFAFLSPRIRSSRQQVLSARVEELLKVKDNRTLQTVLSEAGVIDRLEKNLNQLEKLEISISKDLADHYDRILHYLTEDLKQFFKSYKILWDVERLKMVFCSLFDGHPPEEVERGKPVKHLDLNSVEILSKARDLDERVKIAKKLLPSEFSSQIKIEDDYTLQELLFALDLAVFEYLKKKSEEIGTGRAQLTWEILARDYEIENIITIGRLKYFDVPPKKIRQFLFPVQKLLEKGQVTRLLEAEDYSDFLRILQRTPYKKFVSQSKVNPMELEDLLKGERENLKLAGMLQEDEIDRVTNFLVNLEDQYEVIRKASFFVLLKEGGKKRR